MGIYQDLLSTYIRMVLVRIQYSSPGYHSTVSVVGGFSAAGGKDWTPAPLYYSSGSNEWITVLDLLPGCYAYKLVDGIWTLVPGAETEIDTDGNVNSLLIVEEEMEEVYEDDYKLFKREIVHKATKEITEDLSNLVIREKAPMRCKDKQKTRIVCIDEEPEVKLEKAFLISSFDEGTDETSRRITRGFLRNKF